MAAENQEDSLSQAASKGALLSWFQGCGKVMSEVGIAGFAVISITLYIFLFTSQAYKDRITETWLLFESESTFPPAIIIFVLIATLIMQQKHYKRVIKMKDGRIAELAGEKNNAYSRLLKTKLSSSKKK